MASSCVQLFATLWTAACQTPLSMGFSRQEYWSGLPCCPPGNLPNPGIKPASLISPALAGTFFYHSGHLGSLYLNMASPKPSLDPACSCLISFLLVTSTFSTTGFMVHYLLYLYDSQRNHL